MNKGLYTRGYLPHWDFKNAMQAVTFRLDDAVPRHLVKAWKQDLEEIENDEIREKELRRLIAKYEDAGHGSCILRDYDCATIVQDELRKNHEISYKSPGLVRHAKPRPRHVPHLERNSDASDPQ